MKVITNNVAFLMNVCGRLLAMSSALVLAGCRPPHNYNSNLGNGYVLVVASDRNRSIMKDYTLIVDDNITRIGVGRGCIYGSFERDNASRIETGYFIIYTSSGVVVETAVYQEWTDRLVRASLSEKGASAPGSFWR